MRVTLTRIAVAQLGCIFYCMGAAALAGKLYAVKGTVPLPIVMFVRNYGLALTLVPIVWLILSLLHRHLRKTDEAGVTAPLLTGVGLTFAFFVFALWLTLGPLHTFSKVPVPKPRQSQATS